MLISLNIILLGIVIYFIISIKYKENYDWNMDGTIGGVYPTGSCEGQETNGHTFQTQTGKTNTDYTLYMGSDKTKGNSYIQSVQWGTSVAPLYLNWRGGDVTIGGTKTKMGDIARRSSSRSTIYTAPDDGVSFHIVRMLNTNYFRDTDNNMIHILKIYPSKIFYSNIQAIIYTTGRSDGPENFSGRYIVNIYIIKYLV